ncbi:ABC transporter permease [Stella sp.]|uniref:ABC transporter permease n=1 Tax=Stella sp. TaxID=2912054 RepID=UPI0035ADB462
MIQFLLVRLSLFAPILLGVLLIGFLLLQVVPSDPAAIRAGPMATAEVIEAIREELGLNRPLPEQFLIYLAKVLQGDLGRSLISNAKVVEELAATLPPTVELMAVCMLWAVPLGIALGTMAAVHRGGLLDRMLMLVSVAGVSMPVFFVGILLIWVFGFWLQVLPTSGRGGPLWTLEGWQSILLPALTLGCIILGPIARVTRTSVIEALGADHVRTARAKGLSWPKVIVRHGLRNALVPVVTLIGLQVGFLLGGAVVTETMFAWPGIGRLAVGAILSNDLPVAQGAIICLSLGFITINLGVDMLYAALDPRIRLG